MKRATKSIIVNPRALSAEEKARFADALYAVHTTIFDGVTREAFEKYVIDSKAEHTVIQVYIGEEGTIVGYFGLHFFERDVDGAPCTIVRGECGVLSDYRGSNAVGCFGFVQGLLYALKNPHRTMFFLSASVHPSSYSTMERHFDQVWPCAEKETPAHLSALTLELARSFGLDAVNDANPFVVKVGWRTRRSAADNRAMRCLGNAARFFIEKNSGYAEGNGLLTLVPLSFAGIMRAFMRYARTIVEKRIAAFGRLGKLTRDVSL